MIPVSFFHQADSDTCKQIAAVESLENRSYFTAYFVDPVGGSDLNTGRSAIKAWQTLNAVNTHTFRRGDQILLTGTFEGQALVLGPSAAGVTVNSYAYNVARRKVTVGAASPAFLNDVPGSGISVTASNITIENLHISASPASLSDGSYNDGIYFFNATSAELSHETVNNVTASGFSYSGLVMQGWNTSAADSKGFSNVLIENSAFFGNQVSGLLVSAGDSTGNNFTQGFPANLYLNTNVTVKNVQAFSNAGYNSAFLDSPDSSNPNDGNYTSGGIFISSVNNAIVENCTAYNNCFAGNGSVGIWSFNSTRVNFLSNESYNNASAGAQDGDGFDFDHGVTDSILQRDYSHGNAGAGFLLTTNGGTSNNTGDTIRFCVSDDDGVASGESGINIGSVPDAPILNANVYNNTVLVGPNAAGNNPTAIGIYDTGTTSNVVNLLNNIAYASGTDAVAVAQTGPSSGVQVEGNDYWVVGEPTSFNVNWNGTTYTALAAFAAATGEETYKAAPIGQNQDPMLVSETVSDLPKANDLNLELMVASPLKKEGLNLTTRQWSGVAPYNQDAPYNLAGKAWSGVGALDFFNHGINHRGIGAG